MKLVKEHINFERGLDPKVAMDTGDVFERKLDKIYREMCALASEFDISLEHVIKDKQGAFTEFEYKGYTYILGANENWDDETEWEAEWEYSVSRRKARVSVDDNEYQFDDIESIEEGINEIRKWLIKDKKTLKESYNFQRGLDPKDAMQTGNIQKREEDRILKIMRRYMRAAIKEYVPNTTLKSKDYHEAEDTDLNYKSYYFKIQKYQFQLKYYYNMPIWDLELNYYGFKRYISLEHTTLKDFVHEIRLAMLDLDLR